MVARTFFCMVDLPTTALLLMLQILLSQLPLSKRVALAGNAAVVQGHARLSSGTISFGDTVVCGSVSKSSSFSFPGGSLVHSCNGFDFSNTNLFLEYFSTYFSSQAPTSHYVCRYSSCTVTGTRAVNIFAIPSATFGSMNELTINSAANSFVIINVDGATNSMENYAISLEGGIDNQHVFYNFYQTTSLTIYGIAVEVRSSAWNDWFTRRYILSPCFIRELWLLPVR